MTIDRSVTRDGVTLAGVALWLAGTAAGAIAPIDALRLAASIAAVVGLTLWLAGPLRLGMARRRSGRGTAFSSMPVLALIGLGVVGSLVLGVAVLAAWTLR